MLHDQYGNIVPDDLVLLPSYANLTDEERNQVDQATWYEYHQILMASAKEIGELSEDDPIDSGVNLAKLQDGDLLCVNAILHRGNPVDGWYHA